MGFGLVVWDWNSWVYWFGAGGLIHWTCDALTVTGAPVGWWSDRRITIFGGKVKTGGTYEYIITSVIVAICVLLIVTRATTAGGFIPFFYEWGDFFERGLVDGLEWRTNRFNMI
jgi:inner membrane protein